MERSAARTIDRVGYAALVVLALLIGGFSLFVGYKKAFAPLAVLAEHSAWTIHLPVALGRALGLLELAAASAMILSLPFRQYAGVGPVSAGWITLNHAVAAGFHIAFAEWHTLPQSAVLITLCLILVALYVRRSRSRTEPASHAVKVSPMHR